MRRVLLLVALAGVVCLLADSVFAQSKSGSQPRPGATPIPLRPTAPPLVPTPVPLKPAPPPKPKPIPKPTTTSGNKTSSSTTSSSQYKHNHPYYPYPYGYNPYAYNRNGYNYGAGMPSYYYDPYTGYGYWGYSPFAGYSPYGGYGLGPIFLNPWQLYGPGPIMQMMGVSSWFQNPTSGGYNRSPRVFHQPVRDNGGDQGGNDPANDQGNNEKPRPERASNQRSTDLAMKYVKFGDNHFANQKYSEAYDRYKKAAVAGPQLADTWFRQGFALAALGRYEQAVRAINRGYDINPDWAKSDFQLTEIYGGDEKTKRINLDSLAKAAEGEPNNGDLALLLGIHYYFDGQKDKATPLFERAKKSGAHDALVKSFLGE